MNCQICNQPLRLIPAGVSRTTGKAYGQFWACNDRTHKQPRVAPAYPQQPQQPIYPQSTPQGNLGRKVDALNGGRDFYKENFGKCKHAFLVEAYRDYTNDKQHSDEGLIEEEAERWATMSMRRISDVKDEPLTPEEENSIGKDYPAF